MTQPNLRIGPLPDTTPVKLHINLDPGLSADLKAYAQIYEQAYGDKADVAALIPSMLSAFLTADTGFKKARRELTTT